MKKLSMEDYLVGGAVLAGVAFVTWLLTGDRPQRIFKPRKRKEEKTETAV